MTLQRPPRDVHVADANGAQDHRTLVPGSYHWNDAARTHTVTNLGTTRIELVEIEWK